VALEQRVRREDHPRRAKAALRAVLLVERGLDDGEALGRPEPLESRDRGAVGSRERRQARATRLAVDERRARSAPTLLAAGLRARDPELLAQDVEARGERRAPDLAGLAVDGQLHQAPFSSATTRSTSTGSICSRYQAEASTSSGSSSPASGVSGSSRTAR